MGNLLVPNRIDTSELLDSGCGNQRDVNTNLQEIERLNRYSGGFGAITRHLYPRIQQANRPLVILDLGTGSAGIPAEISAWAVKRSFSVRVLGLDVAMRNLESARSRIPSGLEISLIGADASNLPLREGSVDYVISSLLLHHFPPAQVVDLLRMAYSAARSGIIMSDLVRGWLPYGGFHVLKPVFARHPFTRHDGTVSILRAYTRQELRQMALEAGIEAPSVTSHWAWRQTLNAYKLNEPA